MEARVIDLRSDTVTKPTSAMRRVMAEAVVGDDVFGDDPTVRELEHLTASLLGQEAAVFVPSGTMANQLAIRSQTQPGDELLLEGESHIAWYEAGGPAALSGVTCRALTGDRGVLTGAVVRAALRPVDIHYPPSRMLAVENTHNRGGGRVWPLDILRDVCATARAAGLCTHLDGARLWNAAVATGRAESEYAREFDTVSVCFSKGLGAPVGSALAGSSAVIDRARRFRKQWGGGMRQVGLLAAAALHALHHHRHRLADDHQNARQLAEGLSTIRGIKIDVDAVETNMVYFDVPSADSEVVAARLEQRGVLLLPHGAHSLRAVTSLEVEAELVTQAVAAIAEVVADAAR